ncbi:MAG: sulfatase-like hydrolase/transferase [Akkermansiaceae bacterium]|nr:sulfatase-like hydrolase/transferase [Akkermansiaceae bacterium]
MLRFTLLILTSLPLLAVKAPPHIILVMADDQGYGDCGYTGHPFVKTPHLDEMSKNSVVFDRFHASAPVCSPTRASVMTGRNPVRTNVPNHGLYLRPQEITIAEALKSNGYLTAHFGKWHIGSVQKESPTSPGGQGFDHWLSGLNFFDRDPYLSQNGKFAQHKGQGSVITMDRAIEHLKKHAKGKPTFTVIWFPSPHDPHRETSSNPELYKGKEHAGYFQEITLLDEQIGKLRKALRDLKIHQNTLLWYTSDNGGLVTESSGGRAKKGSVYQGGLRVPSLLEWPGRFPAKTVSVPSSSSDIYPTLLSLTEGTIENQPLLDGIDLVPFIDGKETTRKKPLGFWHHFAGGNPTWNDRIIKQLMEAQKAGKETPLPTRLLKNVNDFPTYSDGAHKKGHAALLDWPHKIHAIYKNNKTTWELYDLDKDPMESKDLSPIFAPEKLESLKEKLTAWQKSVLRSHEGKDYR